MTKAANDAEVVAFDLDELEYAERYQRWVTAAVLPYLGSRILEFGSGTGNMSRWLPRRERLILTEPDEHLRARLVERCREYRLGPPLVSVEAFDPESELPERFADERIDTAVSFNVLEHIRNDAAVLTRLAALLRGTSAPGPRRLVLFVPAHQWAYGTLDTAFGHERRYSGVGLRRLLNSVAPDAAISVRYFNLLGLPGWFILGKILRRDTISPRSIRAFERICPVYRPVDDFLHQRLRVPAGQSLIGVAEWAGASPSPP